MNFFARHLARAWHFLVAYGAYWWYGRPARNLVVIGVTGTKGKSTTCRLIASALEAGGHCVGLLSTVEFQIGARRFPNGRKMTMLGRGEIQKLLRRMVRAGCRYAVIETSSEGILQFRHVGLRYDIAVFTNLGSEHEERHGGFERLKQDKGKMFAALRHPRKRIAGGPPVRTAIIANLDDPHATYFLSFPVDEKYGFSVPGKAAVTGGVTATLAERVESGAAGIAFTAGGFPYRLNLVGEFNVYNALPAIIIATRERVPLASIQKGLGEVAVVPGRMEFIAAGQNFEVVVDYAHEPMSLTALFTALRARLAARPAGRLIGIVGSDGGGRDQGKRQRMGEIAGRWCDVVIITDVNCFDEDPAAIAEMLAAGARAAGKRPGVDLIIEVDRRQAIARAFSLATPGDIVALTAKGTEPWIAVAKGEKIPWDDRLVVKALLKKECGRGADAWHHSQT